MFQKILLCHKKGLKKIKRERNIKTGKFEREQQERNISREQLMIKKYNKRIKCSRQKIDYDPNVFDDDD